MKQVWAASAIVVSGLCVQSAEAGSIPLPVESGGAYTVPVTTMTEARYSAMIRQKYDFSCGSAALSTLLTYHYRFPVSEQAVFEEMFARGEQEKIRKEGFSLLDMKRYLEAHGYEADGFEAPLAKLAAAGIPAIVLINDNGYNHFVVIKGVHDQRVLIGDPSGGTRAMTQAKFESIWANQILFIISSHQDVAGFNLAADWRVAVRAPLGSGIERQGLGQSMLPKFGNSDF
jgi:predicted double-glycine peptidase